VGVGGGRSFVGTPHFVVKATSNLSTPKTLLSGVSSGGQANESDFSCHNGFCDPALTLDYRCHHAA